MSALHAICLTWDSKFFDSLRCVDEDILEMHLARSPSDVELLMDELPCVDAIIFDTDTFHLDRASGLKSLVSSEGRMVRVLAWYDNEWGFSARMADVAVAMGRLND